MPLRYTDYEVPPDFFAKPVKGTVSILQEAFSILRYITLQAQRRSCARIDPFQRLPSSLLPKMHGYLAIPPRLHYGCRMENDALIALAIKRGCKPRIDHNTGLPCEHPNAGTSQSFIEELLQEETGLNVKSVPVFMGNLEVLVFSFGTNRHLETLPSQSQLDTIKKIMEIEDSDLGWFVDNRHWFWVSALNLCRLMGLGVIDAERWLKKLKTNGLPSWL